MKQTDMIVYLVTFVILIGIAVVSIGNRGIVDLFKETDFNIPDDYVILWTSGLWITRGGRGHLDGTDWHYWETEIYNSSRPSDISWVELWLNTETMESYYVEIASMEPIDLNNGTFSP